MLDKLKNSYNLIELEKSLLFCSVQKDALVLKYDLNRQEKKSE